MQHKNPFLSIITSGSFAGIQAIFGITSVVYAVMNFLIIADNSLASGFIPNTKQLVYAFCGVLVFMAFCYMYFRRNQLQLHKVLWAAIIGFNLLMLFEYVVQLKEFSIVDITQLMSIVLGMCMNIFGFVLAWSEAEMRAKTDKENEKDEGERDEILQRYLRPGLTAAGLALVLAAEALINLIRKSYIILTPGDSYRYDSVFAFAIPFVAGILVFIAACITVWLGNGNARLQKYSWLVAMLASVVFFIPVIDSFGRFFIYSVHSMLFPIIMLFLSVRGYCLAEADDILGKRQSFEPRNMYDKPFYLNAAPAGITSSRLGMVALLLWLPVVFGLIFSLERALGNEYDNLEYLLVLVPFFLLYAGYMYIYHAPYKPQKHKAWWWYSLVLNGIAGIVGGVALVTEGKIPIGATILLIITALVSFYGITRSELDDAYETRLK